MMEIAKQLICSKIGALMVDQIDIHQLDFEKIAQQQAVYILEQIQQVILQSDWTDFEQIDAIVDILYANGLDVGGCHDF